MGWPTPLRPGWLVAVKSCPSICRERGCGQPQVPPSHYCVKHQQAATRTQRVHDDVDKMYQRTRWLRFRNWIHAQNPICQRINRGEQCRNPSKICHHLISPRRDPSRFLDATAVCMLCEHCHPPDEGTETWRVGVDYVPTEFGLPKF